MGWALFFREQALCRCSHTRGEHRAGPVRMLVHMLLGRSDACTLCPCRSFLAVPPAAGREKARALRRQEVV